MRSPLGDSSWTITPGHTGRNPTSAGSSGKRFLRIGLPNSEVVQVGITLDAQVADAKGWLDYVAVDWNACRRPCRARPSKNSCAQKPLRRPRIVEWSMAEAQSVQRVWDVTDPQQPIAIPFSVRKEECRGSGSEYDALASLSGLEPVRASTPNGHWSRSKHRCSWHTRRSTWW